MSTPESTKHGSKTAYLVQILAVPRDTDNLKVLFTGDATQSTLFPSARAFSAV